jgi:O-antigen ligase
LVFVVVKTRVYGALAFFLGCSYNTLVVPIGPTTLVPVAFAALAVAMLLHLRRADALGFHPAGKSMVATYLALMAWVLVRGWIGLQNSKADLQALFFLLCFVNVLPVVLADALSWSDGAVEDFAQGFVAAVLLQMIIVWDRAVTAGISWTSWITDFWLTRWSSQEISPFIALTGITNYHWYSWNLGMAALAVLFVLRGSATRYRRLQLAAAGVFMIACIQQIAVVGSRQSILSLIFAVLITSWAKVRKALLNVTAFMVVALLVLMALRTLADLEPLPIALMHGADSVNDAFNPAISRGLEWQQGVQAFLQSPFIGVGFGSEEGFSLGHNLVINTLANLGLIGMAAFSILVGLYVTGPLRTALRQRGPGLGINRGLVALQLFLIGTSFASGSVVASSGLFWLGAIIVRRAPKAERKRTVPVRGRPAPLPA